MKILSLRLKGYIGIYNGMHLSDIFIDFRRCMHNKIIIKGENGRGKSTILKAADIIPDNNSAFVPGVKAEKIIEILDHDVLYIIKYVHGLKSNGDRDTVKGYITKCIGPKKIELNPNGNISSCKELLFTEFDLDSNFIALSSLSSEDRGIVEKKPAERKRFMNGLLSGLDTYNNIHKKLTKKSSILRANKNMLSTKIDNIGDESKLLLSLDSINQKIDALTQEKEKCIGLIATYRSNINTMDPNGDIQKEYTELSEKIADNSNQLNFLYNQINIMLKDLSLSEDNDIDEIKNQLEKYKIQLETEISIKERYIETMLLDRENEAKQLQLKTQKLQSLTNDENYSDLLNKSRELKNNIGEYKKIIDMIGIEDITILTKEEYIDGLNVLKEIKDTVDVFRASASYSEIECAINYINNNIKIEIEIDEVNKKIESINNQISSNKIEIDKYKNLLLILNDLSLRPKECNIDSCPFIKSALEAKKQNPEIMIDKIGKEINYLEKELKSYITKKEYLGNVFESINFLNRILRSINGYKHILKKLPNGVMFSDKNEFIRRLAQGNNFNEINDLYQYMNYANIIELYNTDYKALQEINTQLIKYASKKDIIDSIKNDMDALVEKTNNITHDIEENRNTISDNKKTIDDINKKLTKYDTLGKMLKEYNGIKESNNSITNKYNTLYESMNKINVLLQEIENNQHKISNINIALNPLNKDRDRINHSINLLHEYLKELELYTTKYDKVETIRHYASPTKGIQNIFMEIYMNKIIDMSNQLLSMLFNNEYVLLPFVITADEFRIPCQGSGILNDDISSMSTAQKCMISMIISFTLLYNSSSKYNIMRLDEIDGFLDTNNRLYFTVLLDQIMELLECEQCIIISHNNELDTENADIILLDDATKNPIPGNIIWSL